MVNNGIISAPINIKDPYTCIGVGTTANGYDLGYICSNMHEKINMWSRYKPVPFKDTLYFNDTIKTVNGHSTWNDTPINQGSDGALNRPWYMGGISYKLYIVPTISSYNDMFVDGEPSPESEWKYQAVPDADGYYSRLEDFIGYNHYARCPLSAFTNYTEAKDSQGNVKQGYTPIDGNIIAGFNNVVTWNDDALAKENGEMTFEDIVNMITYSRPLPLYLSIVVRNLTQNVTRSYSKPVNILDENGRSFKLEVGSSQNIAQGGVAHTVKIGDELAIGVYLSQQAGVEGIGTQLPLGFSLNTGLNNAPHVCRKVKVAEATGKVYDYYKILYNLTTFTYNAEGYIDELDSGFNMSYPVYFRAEDFGNPAGNIYSCEKGVQNVRTVLSLQKLQKRNSNGVWEDTDAGIEFEYTLKITANMYGGENSYGLYIGSIPLISTNKLTGVDITNKKQLSGAIFGETKFYSTQSNAEENKNGSVASVIPLALPKLQADPFSEVHFELTFSIDVSQSVLFENAIFSFENTSNTPAYFNVSN